MKPLKIEGSRKLGKFVEPMLAQPIEREPFDDKDWVFEFKLDGYRAIAEITSEGNLLYSRKGLTFDKAYKKVFDALDQVPINAVLDGEIVVYDSDGRPDFQKLQNYKNSDKAKIQYCVFDCLEINGQRIINLTLLQRKELLKDLLPESDVIVFCDHVEGEGKKLFKEAQRRNLEGIVAKRKASKYHLGKRSADWLKIKHTKTTEAVIVGYTKPKGLRNYFGALILGIYRDGDLVAAGNVGTGFSENTLKALYEQLQKIETKSCPLDVPVKVPDSIWVQPILVCEVRYGDITEDQILRHTTFVTLRKDKSPEDLM